MPRLDAIRTFPYRARAYNYTTSATPDGGTTRSYSYFKDVRCDLNTGSFGRIVIYFPEADGLDLLPQARLLELVDAHGNELYPGGVWTLQGIVPMVTIFGTREGFQADVRLTHETLVS